MTTAPLHFRSVSGGLFVYAAAAVMGRLSSRASAIAVTLLALETTGSPLIAGVLTAFSVLPSLIVGPLLGLLIDRADNPRLYYLAGPVLFAASAVGVAFTLHAGLWPVAALIAFVGGVALPMFEGAMTPLVNYVVPEESLGRGYAMDATSYSTSSILGPLVASLSAAAFGPFWALMVVAGLSLGSLVFILALPIPRRARRRLAVGVEAEGEPGGRLGGAGDLAAELEPIRFAQIWTGLAVLWRVKQLRGTTLASSLASMGKDSVFPLAATLLALEWGRAASDGGFLLVIQAVGGLIGSIVVTIVQVRLEHASQVLYATLFLSGAAFVASSFSHSLVVVGLIVFGCGLLNGPMTTATIVVRSAYTPPELRTQVFTTAMSLRATSSTGAIAGGALGSVYGGSGLMAFIGISQLVAAVAGLLVSRTPSSPVLRLPKESRT